MPMSSADTHEELQRQQALQARCVHPTGQWQPFRQVDTAQSLGQRFTQQATQRPQQVALQTAEDVWTYAMLNSTANRIAHALVQQRGDQSEPVLVLCTEAPWAIAAMLGIWKAGKYCVPLDPAAPQERWAALFDDSQPVCLVTDATQEPLVAAVAPPGCQLVNLSTLAPDLPSHDPTVAVAPDALAYVLYTSGSTGRPKGVMDTHRNALHHIRQLTNRMHICAEDRHALLRSYGFGGAMRDIFSALLNGSSLHILRLDLEGVPRLGPWLQEEGVTICRLGVSVFRQWTSTLTGVAQVPALRVIYVGGEPATGNDVALFQRHFAPPCVFINGMGMTEVGTACHYFVDHQTPMTDSALPGGYAVEDMTLLVLDDAGAPLEHGQVGELVLQSPYLSPGYWRNPTLTAAAFRAAPEGLPARRYHTGDLGISVLTVVSCISGARMAR